MVHFKLKLLEVKIPEQVFMKDFLKFPWIYRSSNSLNLQIVKFLEFTDRQFPWIYRSSNSLNLQIVNFLELTDRQRLLFEEPLKMYTNLNKLDITIFLKDYKWKTVNFLKFIGSLFCFQIGIVTENHNHWFLLNFPAGLWFTVLNVIRSRHQLGNMSPGSTRVLYNEPLFFYSSFVWRISIHLFEFCMMNIYSFLRLLYVEPLFIYSSFVWRTPIHLLGFCMTNLYSFIRVLHDEPLFIYSSFAWQTSIHSFEFCMTNLYSSIRVLYDEPLFIYSSFVWRTSIHLFEFCMTNLYWFIEVLYDEPLFIYSSFVWWTSIHLFEVHWNYLDNYFSLMHRYGINTNLLPLTFSCNSVI